MMVGDDDDNKTMNIKKKTMNKYCYNMAQMNKDIAH